MARNRYDMDEALVESFDIRQLKRLGSYLIPYKRQLAGAVALMLSSSALMMMIPIFLAQIMDVCIPSKNMQGIILYAGATVLITVYSVISLKLKIKMTTNIGQAIIHELRADLFHHLQKLPFTYYDNRPHGKIQVRVVNYVNNLSDLLSNGIINTVTDMFNLLFILIFMFYLSPRLTFICLCGLPILTVLVLIIKKRQRQAWQIQGNKQSNLNAYIAESLNGIHVTQAFVREEENSGIFNRLSDNYRQTWMRAVRLNFLLGPSVETISIITIAVIYVFGVQWIARGNVPMTAGMLIAFTSYVSRFWQPINTLAGFYNSLLTAVSYLERIFETIDEPVLIEDDKNAIPMPPMKGTVIFKNVVFGYEDGAPVLNGIDFIANAGESFAIVGPTGSGKSTIVNLISRFYNLNAGQILIDEYDISQVTLESLRKQMGVMMQDSFIFSGTIMDNIRYGRREATEEEVINAAKVVRAHDFISKLKDGYDTEVNERGSRLSAGQRQLISFARALLADPKILILDEATSSIDTETEMLLQEGLNQLLKGRTSFLIAHRLATIRSADCILYIDKGKIQEQGSHEALLEKKGMYYRLFTSQYAFNC